MKKVFLSILAIGIMAALGNAESCGSIGATEKKYTPQGECDYKTEIRTCCEDKQWSGWNAECEQEEKGCDINDMPAYEKSSPNYDPMERKEQAANMCKVEYCDICWNTYCDEKTKQWKTKWNTKKCEQCQYGRFFVMIDQSEGKCVKKGSYIEGEDYVHDYITVGSGCPSYPTKASKLSGCYGGGGQVEASSMCETYTGSGPCGTTDDWVLSQESYRDPNTIGHNSTISNGGYYECGWSRKYYTCTGYSGE